MLDDELPSYQISVVRISQKTKSTDLFEISCFMVVLDRKKITQEIRFKATVYSNFKQFLL